MAVADLHVHGAPAGQANGPDVSAGRCSPRRQQQALNAVSPDRTHSACRRYALTRLECIIKMRLAALAGTDPLSNSDECWACFRPVPRATTSCRVRSMATDDALQRATHRGDLPVMRSAANLIINNNRLYRLERGHRSD